MDRVGWIKKHLAGQMTRRQEARISTADLMAAIPIPAGTPANDYAHFLKLAAEEIAREIGADVEWNARERVFVFHTDG